MAAMARSSAFLANSNVASSRCQEAVILSSPSSLRQTTTASASAALNSKFSGCVLSLKPEQRIGAVNGRNVGVRAMAEAKPSAPEVFEVEVEKPYGLRFYKGADGGTYIDVIQPGSNAGNTGVFTVGDKVLATSAVFGNDIWPAAEYGRTMYTIRQRVGPLLMKMEKRYGKREDQANTEQIAKERNAGQIGDAVREIQIQNYLRKQELKEERAVQLNEGLKLYKAGKYQEALESFETVLGLKPEYREVAVASYNVACCYSKLNQLEAGLSALDEAMEAGFEDYKTIREDPDLANLRSAPNFTATLEKYDEPFFNENAFKAIKNVFRIFGKKT